ncbi:uncharacterized protein BXIN_2759 [Babesia sp. Xinjiang]|uniref:uncharacterized protein n=1 Tax=Babesia sp. Xinjiang TaxID=462227 RepID=UPI000A214F6A|nr:uncharacterized protein BXIN_2759 [Babesia sp. Xinjiang]ORM41700.1 hypothetical protein BXIN_2759 [Babesia sp. Xinjiang]
MPRVVSCGPLQLAFYTVIRLALLLALLTGSTARKVSKEQQTHFTPYGEPCEGDKCHFDADPVGQNLGSFCVTNGSRGGHPVQLVRPAENHLGLELVEEGLRVLSSLPKPLAIVAAIGSIKTGKSSLMNVINEHVLCSEGDKLQGFDISDTVNPTTQGIWLWSEPIELDCNALKEQLKEDGRIPNIFDHLVTMVTSVIGETVRATVTAKTRLDISKCEFDKVNIVFMDVEGFNAIDGFQRYDEALFTIAAAMSSELVYLTHKVMDARDILDLQHMLQTSTSMLVNMYRSLSNVPHVVKQEDSNAQGHKGVSVSQQTEMSELGNNNSCDANKCQKSTSDGEIFADMLLEIQRNTTLTLSVQGFDLKLQQSALDYINGIVNKKRFDMDYSDQKSFFDYLEQTRVSLLNLFKREKGKGKEPLEQIVSDIIARLTSRYKSNLPHLLGSIDVLLTSAPSARRVILNKSELFRGYLQHVLNYKMRLFKRSALQPKKRISPVSNGVTLMTGEDLVNVITHLVKALNEAMKNGSLDSQGDFRLTRANLIKQDLVDLYSAELLKFIHKMPIPLEGDLEKFNQLAETRYLHLMALYAQYDLSPLQFSEVNTDFKSRLHEIRERLGQKLHDITLQYCRSKMPQVKNLIRERIEGLKLPVLPAVIGEFENNKQQLVRLYLMAVDDNEVKYSTSAACKETSLEIVEFVESEIRDLSAENESEINMLFQEATRRAVESFIANADRNALEKYKVNYEDFTKSLQSWSDTAYEVYYKAVGEFKQIQKFNKASLSFLRQQFSMLEKESRDHWNDVCRDSVLHVSQEFQKTFDVQLQQLLPYRPVPKPVLKVAIEYLRFRKWREMSNLHCGTSQTVRNTQQLFDRMVHELGHKALADNDEAIFRHFDKEFKAMYQEALDRVDQVYHFYQLKKHLHWYAKWHVFAHVKIFEQLLRPKRVLEELQKNIDAEIVKAMPNDVERQTMLEILHFSNSKSLKALGLDGGALMDAIIEQWLRERLYPRIRGRIMLRMPKLSTFFAIVGVVVSSSLLLRVRHARMVCFLCLVNALALVYILGMRRVLLIIGISIQYCLNWLMKLFAYLGTAWSMAIVSSLVAIALLWSHSMPSFRTSKRQRRARYIVLKQNK